MPEPGVACSECGHFACVCRIRAMHEEGCAFRMASAGNVPIECDHGRDCCPECDPCTCEHEQVVAWKVREGDWIRMPDDRTWCTVERIWREPDTGRLMFMGFVEPWFARKRPDEILRVRRARDA